MKSLSPVLFASGQALPKVNFTPSIPQLSFRSALVFDSKAMVEMEGTDAYKPEWPHHEINGVTCWVAEHRHRSLLSEDAKS